MSEGERIVSWILGFVGAIAFSAFLATLANSGLVFLGSIAMFCFVGISILTGAWRRVFNG